MKKSLLLVMIAMIGFGVSCSRAEKSGSDKLVLIKTEFGDIKVRLYDETPEHQKNFLKLAGEGFYDGLLFHRVINHFMVQGGDPNSKGAPAGERLGAGNPGYTVPAEFVKKYFHKKGALAAARNGGPSNPEKRSSGSQFYIVHGEVYTPGRLDTMEMMINSRAQSDFYKSCFEAANDELNAFRNNNDREGFELRVAEIRAEADSLWTSHDTFSFSPEQRETYTTIGGYPSLDGEYTVFGEVVEGLDVLDKLAAVETDKNNRPLQDIKMEMEVIK